jgi:hypothetical protein
MLRFPTSGEGLYLFRVNLHTNAKWVESIQVELFPSSPLSFPNESFSLVSSYSSVGEIPLQKGKESRYPRGITAKKQVKTGEGMKRQRALQVVLVLVGSVYSFWGYFLFGALWHSKWLTGHNDVLPMFLTLNTVLGVCLLVAVKQPARHRSLIAYGAWSSLAHAFTMTIQSVEAAVHGMHRSDSPLDIVLFGAIGVALLALLPAREQSSAPVSEPRFAEG